MLGSHARTSGETASRQRVSSVISCDPSSQGFSAGGSAPSMRREAGQHSLQQRLFRRKAGNPESMGTATSGRTPRSLKPFPSPLGILFCELRIVTLEEFAEPSYFKDRS